MRSPSVHVLDRCCLRCWGLACLVPGAFLLYLAFGSFYSSATVVALTSQWTYESTWIIVPSLPQAWQQWLREPGVWPSLHGGVTAVLQLPLVLTAGLPGGLAAVVGLSLWEEARQQALRDPDDRVQNRAAPGARDTGRRSRRPSSASSARATPQSIST